MNEILTNLFGKELTHPGEFDSIFNAFMDAVLLYDTRGTVLKVNRAATSIIQLSPLRLNNLRHPKKTKKTLLENMIGMEAKFLSQAMEGQSITDAECLVTNNNGEELHCFCSVAPIYNKEMIGGVMIILKDITELKQKERQIESSYKKMKNLAEKAQKQRKLADRQIEDNREAIITKDSQIMVSDKLIEIIFSNTHFLIAYLDTDFYIHQVNDAYANAFNQSPNFFVGKNHFDLFIDEGSRQIFDQVVKSGESHITYAEPFFKTSKIKPEISYWDWSLQPIKTGEEVEGVILILIDVTRRKKAEEDLFNAKRLSDIGALAATVAHELRNPLGVIQAAAYNIKRKNQNPDIDRHILNINVK